VPEHASVPQGEAALVETQSDLDAALHHLRQPPDIAFDTEFIGEETYFPQLCLIQVGTREAVYLIDPLADVDCNPLFELLASKDCRTLVHAGRQDLQILARAIGRPADNVIDTQLLAGLAGLPWPCSLTKSVRCVIDAPMPGGMTFTAWDRRPLSKQQRRYAADDVRYLPLLHDHLSERVSTLGHETWAAAACDALSDPAIQHIDLRSQQRKIEGNRRFKSAERRVLTALVSLRDELARIENLPPRATIPDSVLLSMTRRTPATPEAIGNLKGMPRNLAMRHGERIIAATTEAIYAPEGPPVRRPREESPEDRVAIDGLWHAFAAHAIARGTSPTLVLSRSELAHWFLTDRQGTLGRAPWQQDIVTALIEPLLNANGPIEIHWRPGDLEDPS